MKTKVRCTFHLYRRLYNVLVDIMPLFADLDAEDPKRGAMTKALEHVLQQYMTSKDYQEKMDFTKRVRWDAFLHMCEKERELQDKSPKKKKGGK